MRIAVLNGPNLNLLGIREPALYGRETLADIEERLRIVGREIECELEFAQQNGEGELIDVIHRCAAARRRADQRRRVSRTRVSRFATRSPRSQVPFVEVHLTNVYAREPERRHSMLAGSARRGACAASARRLRARAARARRARSSRPWLTAARGASPRSRDALDRRAPRRGCCSRACRTSAISPDSPARARCVARHRARDACSSPISATRRRCATRSATSRASPSSRRACGPGSGSSSRELDRDRRSSASSPRTCCTATFSGLLNAGARWQWRPTDRSRRDAARAEGRERDRAHRRRRPTSRTRALERTLPQVRAGMTELAGRRSAREGAARRGKRGISIPVDRRVRSARRRCRTRARRTAQVARGDFLLIDFGADVGRLLLRHHAHVRGRTRDRRAARGLRRRARARTRARRRASAPE